MDFSGFFWMLETLRTFLKTFYTAKDSFEAFLEREFTGKYALGGQKYTPGPDFGSKNPRKILLEELSTQVWGH